jgi:hypothetical protein
LYTISGAVVFASGRPFIDTLLLLLLLLLFAIECSIHGRQARLEAFDENINRPAENPSSARVGTLRDSIARFSKDYSRGLHPRGDCSPTRVPMVPGDWLSMNYRCSTHLLLHQ